MKLTLSLPDELFEAYLAQTPQKDPKRVQETVLKRLQRFSDVPDNERTIVVKGQDRLDLEALFQLPIVDGRDLVNRTKKLCTVQIGHVERSFAQDELARIQMQAEFVDMRTEDFIYQMVDEIINRFMEKV